MIRGTAIWLSLLGLSGFSDEVGCDGFIPQNTLSIPVSSKRAPREGLTENEYNATLDKISREYAVGGRHIELIRLWKDSRVNAYAMINKKGQSVVTVHGGIARHRRITADGLLLIACHEVGHHFGGAPRRKGNPKIAWASVEGQADYFATLRCMREILGKEDNAAFLSGVPLDPFADKECQIQYAQESDRNLCRRISLAIQSLTELFADIKKESNPRFAHPDMSIVNETISGHPSAQCRMDTFFQASLCLPTPVISLSGMDPNLGTCSIGNGHNVGMRARCWYKD